MAYNRENLLKRIIEVQNIVKEQKKHDTPQTKIYKKFIKDRFYISYSTFNEWLGIPAHAQLEKLLASDEKQKELEKRQLNLFDE